MHTYIHVHRHIHIITYIDMFSLKSYSRVLCPDYNRIQKNRTSFTSHSLLFLSPSPFCGYLRPTPFPDAPSLAFFFLTCFSIITSPLREKCNLISPWQEKIVLRNKTFGLLGLEGYKPLKYPRLMPPKSQFLPPPARGWDFSHWECSPGTGCLYRKVRVRREMPGLHLITLWRSG